MLKDNKKVPVGQMLNFVSIFKTKTPKPKFGLGVYLTQFAYLAKNGTEPSTASAISSEYGAMVMPSSESAKYSLAITVN